MKTPTYDIPVNDRKSFIRFLELFHQDFLVTKKQWENNTLESFLEAMTRYAQDIEGYYQNTNQSIDADIPGWAIFADILKGSKVYE